MGRTPPIFRPSYSGRAEAYHAWGFGPLFVPFLPACCTRNTEKGTPIRGTFLKAGPALGGMTRTPREPSGTGKGTDAL